MVNDSIKDDLWRHFFKNPRKNYNPYILRLLDYPEYIIFDKEIMDSHKGKWKEFFKNDNPVYLEIGSGSGNFADPRKQLRRGGNAPSGGKEKLRN